MAFQQIDFSKVNRLLEIGCGNGKLWENNHYNLEIEKYFYLIVAMEWLKMQKNYLEMIIIIWF